MLDGGTGWLVIRFFSDRVIGKRDHKQKGKLEEPIGVGPGQLPLSVEEKIHWKPLVASRVAHLGLGHVKPTTVAVASIKDVD